MSLRRWRVWPLSSKESHPIGIWHNENLQRSVGLQQKYYDQKHRDVHYNVGDLVLLSTHYLKMKGAPAKLQHRFVGPFKIIEVIGQ